VTKYYAKKRDVMRAVQWTGEMTADVQELIKYREVSVDPQQRLQLGSGWHAWHARVGDWIYSTSGEDLSVDSDEVFRKTYEAVDDVGRPMPPTADEHENAGREFVEQLDTLLADSLHLSRETHPDIFQRRDRLVRTLRRLLEDHAFVAAQRRELAWIRAKINREL
jgi:hypothetical protein